MIIKYYINDLYRDISFINIIQEELENEQN